MALEANVEPFRLSGGPFEHSEPIAFAWVEKGKPVTWVGDDVPEQTLWIPEEVVDDLRELLAPSSLLSTLDLYRQNRLTPEDARRLCLELDPWAGMTLDASSQAAAYIRDLAKSGDSRNGFEFLIEGP